MFKKYPKILIVFLAFLAFHCVPTFALKTNDTAYLTAYYPDFLIKGDSIVKLKDGRILYGIETIFDPKTNTFYKTKYYDKDVSRSLQHGYLLNDGRILFFNPYYDYKSLQQDRSKISTAEQFKKYVEEETKYVKIYDPESDKLEVLAKSKIGLAEPKILSFKDGKMLVAYSMLPNIGYNEPLKFIPSQFEEFDIKTNNFKVVKLPVKSSIERFYPLKDGRIILQTFFEDENNIIFNPKTYSVSTSKHKIGLPAIYLGDGRIMSKKTNCFSVYNPLNDKEECHPFYLLRGILKLNNGKILIFYSDKPKGDVLAAYYMEENNTLEKIGKLSSHKFDTDYTVLKNDNILIGSGSDYKKSGFFAGSVDDNRLEIFDINKGKSKFIKSERMHYGKAILLDDGRVYIDSGCGGHGIRLGKERHAEVLTVKE